MCAPCCLLRFICSSPETRRPRPPPVGVRSSSQGTALLSLPPKLSSSNFPPEAPVSTTPLTWGVGSSGLGHAGPRARRVGSSRDRPRQSLLRSILLAGPRSGHQRRILLPLESNPLCVQPAPPTGAATGGCVPASTSLGAHPGACLGIFPPTKK